MDIDFQKVLRHKGHQIVIVTYGDDKKVWNVAIECEDCSQVIADADILEPNAARERLRVKAFPDNLPKRDVGDWQ